jgi:hypothetical protein
MMAPETVKKLGVETSDEIEITTLQPKAQIYRSGETEPVGHVRNRVRVTSGMHPRVIAQAHPAGHWEHGTIARGGDRTIHAATPPGDRKRTNAICTSIRSHFGGATLTKRERRPRRYLLHMRCFLVLLPLMAGAQDRSNGSLCLVNQVAVLIDERISLRLMVQNRWIEDFDTYQRTVVRPWLSYD